MALKMILATGLLGEIGKENKLLWNLPEDLAYFKKMTTGCSVLMGNLTFASLPFKNGLPNRRNFVLSRTPRKSYWSQDVVWLSGLSPHILSLLTGCSEDVYIIGGASIYKMFMPYVDEVHWTKVNKTYPEADTFYKPDVTDFTLSRRELLKGNDEVSIEVYSRTT